jgi:ATP-dependent exoDNAse (exonuclease V) beta subunit
MSHWYTRDGLPRHKQRKKDGEERDTHVGDAKKQKLLPSVTEIIKIKSEPGLEAHRRRAIAAAAYLCPPSSFETEKEWTAHIMKKADEPGNLAKEFGNLIHARMEGIVSGREPLVESEMVVLPEGPEVPMASLINPTLIVLNDLNLQVQSTERILTSRLGYAGTSDMLATKDGLPIILDYKTTKTEEGEPIVIYPAYQMQIAAYWNAAYPLHSGSGMGGYNIFISSTEPGRVEAHWYDGEELEDAWKEFVACLVLWKQAKKYPSGW